MTEPAAPAATPAPVLAEGSRSLPTRPRQEGSRTLPTRPRQEGSRTANEQRNLQQQLKEKQTQAAEARKAVEAKKAAAAAKKAAAAAAAKNAAAGGNVPAGTSTAAGGNVPAEAAGQETRKKRGWITMSALKQGYNGLKRGFQNGAASGLAKITRKKPATRIATNNQQPATATSNQQPATRNDLTNFFMLKAEPVANNANTKDLAKQVINSLKSYSFNNKTPKSTILNSLLRLSHAIVQKSSNDLNFNFRRHIRLGDLENKLLNIRSKVKQTHNNEEVKKLEGGLKANTIDKLKITFARAYKLLIYCVQEIVKSNGNDGNLYEITKSLTNLIDQYVKNKAVAKSGSPEAIKKSLAVHNGGDAGQGTSASAQGQVAQLQPGDKGKRPMGTGMAGAAAPSRRTPSGAAVRQSGIRRGGNVVSNGEGNNTEGGGFNLNFESAEESLSGINSNSNTD